MLDDTVIASADWLASIKDALDSVESAGQAFVAANLAMQHLDEAGAALQAGDPGSWSSWRSGAVVDLAQYSQRIAEYTNPFVGDPGRDISGTLAWQALRNKIFVAYAYAKVVSGQFSDGEDAGPWNAAIVPMAQSFGQAIADAPRVIAQAAGDIGAAVSQTVYSAASGLLGPFKWWLVAAAVVVLLGAAYYLRDTHVSG